MIRSRHESFMILDWSNIRLEQVDFCTMYVFDTCPHCMASHRMYLFRDGNQNGLSLEGTYACVCVPMCVTYVWEMSW